MLGVDGLPKIEAESGLLKPTVAIDQLSGLGLATNYPWVTPTCPSAGGLAFGGRLVVRRAARWFG